MYARFFALMTVTAISLLTANYSATSIAATQGQLGATSSGGFTITVYIPPSLNAQLSLPDAQQNNTATPLQNDVLPIHHSVNLSLASRGVDHISLRSEGESDAIQLIANGMLLSPQATQPITLTKQSAEFTLYADTSSPLSGAHSQTLHIQAE